MISIADLRIYLAGNLSIYSAKTKEIRAGSASIVIYHLSNRTIFLLENCSVRYIKIHLHYATYEFNFTSKNDDDDFVKIIC